MKVLLSRRPSPALVIAVLALFMSLGAVATATIHLTKNSVKTKNIKNNAVTTKKIKKKAVTTNRLADSSVTAGQLANGAVTDAKLSASAIGSRAYAHVDAGGGVVGSKNVVGVSHPGTGVYCFDLSVAVTTLVASPESGPVRIAGTAVPGSAGLCPEGFRDAHVVILDAAGATQNIGFFAIFD